MMCYSVFYPIIVIALMGYCFPVHAQSVIIQDFYKEQSQIDKENSNYRYNQSLPPLDKKKSWYVTSTMHTDSNVTTIRGSLYIFLPYKTVVHQNKNGDTNAILTNQDACDTLVYIYDTIHRILMVIDRDAPCFGAESDYMRVYSFDENMVLSVTLSFSYPEEEGTIMSSMRYTIISDQLQRQDQGYTVGKSCLELTIDELLDLVKEKMSQKVNANNWKSYDGICSNVIVNTFCSFCQKK